MKKIATSLLILLAIPVFGYLYIMYFYEADPLTQKYIDEKDPVVKLQLLERIMDRGEDEKWSWSDNAAEIAFKTGDYDKAEKYALTSLEMSKDYEGNWNYGNAIHNSNVILGRISLVQEDIDEAKSYLVEAGKSEGSPQLDTFGPNFKLANKLLEKGEISAVVQYLSSISKFWRMDDGCVKRWLSEIENGEKPILCNCNC
jgi:tetratricopeptide (TPR) repeat protein|tara:strand:+ start:1481 stop:2080 length:600 start_codon:yes stop_codon:yes gene_type:complete